MSALRAIALFGLIALFVGVVALGDAPGGERFKTRLVHYQTKWDQVEVGEEEGHIFGLYEGKGIATNWEGKSFQNGWATRQIGFLDMNLKTGTWTGYGHTEFTDPDGDKIYSKWEGKKVRKDRSEGKFTYIKGTGKWQGIQGKGTWVSYSLADRWYSDQEGEVELPR